MNRRILRLAPWLVAGLLLFAGATHLRVVRLKGERAAEEAQIKALRNAASAIVARRAPNRAWREPGRAREWVDSLADAVNALKAALAAVPEQRIPELAYVSDSDWIIAAARLPAEPTADDLHQCISRLQDKAKRAFADAAQKALNRYLSDSGGSLPRDLAELAPYLGGEFDPALSARYQVTRPGSVDLNSERDGAAKLIASVPAAMTDEFSVYQIEVGRTSVDESDGTPDAPTIDIPSNLPRPVQSALAAGLLAYMHAHGGAVPPSNQALKPFVTLPPEESDARRVTTILDS